MSLFKVIIEIGFSAALFVNALLFIPQIIKILKVKSKHGLSLLTFGGFNLIQLFTIMHGIIQKDYLLVIGFVISFITCGIVTALIIFYNATESK